MPGREAIIISFITGEVININGGFIRSITVVKGGDDNNIAYNREMGVKLDGCHDIVVSANQMEENGIGIYGKGLYNATVTGNNIDDHIRNCIYFVNTLGSIITANMLENCLGKSVILDEKCNGIVVTGNTLGQVNMYDKSGRRQPFPGISRAARQSRQ